MELLLIFVLVSINTGDLGVFFGGGDWLGTLQLQ